MIIAISMDHRFYHIFIFLLPTSLAVPFAWWGNQQNNHLVFWEPQLYQIRINTSAQAQSILSQFDYKWPPDTKQTIPALSFKYLPSDLDLIADKKIRKSLFLKILLPIVLAENHRIKNQRAFVQSLTRGDNNELSTQEIEIIAKLYKEYRIEENQLSEDSLLELLLKLDCIPVSLVLAQAAAESGWGMSRFARSGNNLFGIWTYNQPNSLMPGSRQINKYHAIRRYKSLRSSVRSYMYNLNVGHAYGDFRQLRADMRRQKGKLEGITLVQGLHSYSERGQDYVEDIRRLIKANRLQLLDKLSLELAVDDRFAI